MYIYTCDASEFITQSLGMKYPVITAQQKQEQEVYC